MKSVAWVAFFFFSLSALAETQPNAEIKPVEEKSAVAEATKESKESNLLLEDIYKMTRRQKALATRKSEQLQKREELEADVADLQRDIQDVTSQIQALRKKIVLRMRNLHRIGAPTIFQSLLGAQDLTEMDRNARILFKISKADVEQLRTFRGLKNLLSEQQMKLETKIVESEKNQKVLDRQERAIKRNYTLQMDLLKQLSQQDQSLLQKIKDIKKSAFLAPGKKTVQLPSLYEGGLYEKKGALDLPVTGGVISKRFGLLQMNSPKIRVYNKGWFITTIPQKDVVAVHRGQVAYADQLEEYNYVVVLDHGDHFYSVYANLQSTDLRVGEEVESLRSLGQTGYSRLNGHGLYFELRHFSQSEDPSGWFKDAKFHLSSVKEQSL